MPTILLADDDEILIEILRFRVEAAGHSVVIARDGLQALELIRESLPDLVILDAMMPVMTGAEVLAALRADDATADLPVIMLTARAGEDDVVRSLRAGANDYITKPFIPQELAVRIDKLLEQSRASLRAA